MTRDLGSTGFNSCCLLKSERGEQFHFQLYSKVKIFQSSPGKSVWILNRLMSEFLAVLSTDRTFSTPFVNLYTTQI